MTDVSGHVSRISVRYGVTALAVAVCVWVPGGPFTAPSLAKPGPTHEQLITIERGDTLSAIAARHGVTVAEIRKWNPKRLGSGDLIRAGETLRLKVPSKKKESLQPWEAFYLIRSGDTLGGIASRLGVTVSELRRWNKLREGAVIRSGDVIRYEKMGERPSARSSGRPTKGGLHMGEHLGEGRGYRLRFPRNAWALPSTNRWLRRCAARMAERYRGTADVLIGDLSRVTGGRFPPHQSHQSGRDADVGYYLRGNQQNVTLHRVGPADLDYAKNWSLLRCLLATKQVVRVYMDTSLQRGYVQHLKKKGARDSTLAALFEVAAGGAGGALVVHAPKHDTHLHVRFACGEGDASCREEGGDRAFRGKLP